MRLGIAAAALLAVGTAYAAKPVVRWDVIPCQRISGKFNVGLVAFHEDPLKVGFAVNGSIRKVVREPALNPRTGVREYFFELDADQYPAGALTVVAVAKTEKGEQCRIPPLTLYADPARSLGSRNVVFVNPSDGNDYAEGTEQAPFRTLKLAVQRVGDGGTVRLAPGVYSAGQLGAGLEHRYWTIVEPAPGVNREDVKIVCGRLATDKLRFRNVEIVPGTGNSSLVMGEGGKGLTMAWFDNCRFSNPKGRYAAAIAPFGRGLRAFVTGGETVDLGRGPCGEIVRGHSISRIAGSVFEGGGMLVVNCVVDDVDAGDAPDCPDVCKALDGDGWAEGVVLYGVRATACKARAFSGRRVRDMAVVDVTVDTGLASTVAYTQFSGPAENVLFRNVDIGGQKWQWTKTKSGTSDFKPTDVRLYGVKCGGFMGYDAADGSAGLTVAQDL